MIPLISSIPCPTVFSLHITSHGDWNSVSFSSGKWTLIRSFVLPISMGTRRSLCRISLCFKNVECCQTEEHYYSSTTILLFFFLPSHVSSQSQKKKGNKVSTMWLFKISLARLWTRHTTIVIKYPYFCPSKVGISSVQAYTYELSTKWLWPLQTDSTIEENSVEWMRWYLTTSDDMVTSLFNSALIVKAFLYHQQFYKWAMEGWKIKVKWC